MDADRSLAAAPRAAGAHVGEPW